MSETAFRPNRAPQSAVFLYVSLFMAAVVPFLSIWRTGPLASFFLESGSLLFMLLLVLSAAFSGCLAVRLPRAALYFWALALFWVLHGCLTGTPYPGQNAMAAWSFAVLGLAAWACRGWALRLGWQNAVSALAWVLLAGALANATVGWLQYTGLAKAFGGWLMYRPGIVEGQLGQRNHFGHYLMWGMLAAGFLWAQRRMNRYAALAAAVYLASAMGLTGSRTIFGYVLMLAVLLPAARLLGGRETGRTAAGLAAAAALVLAGQFAVEPLLALFSDSHLSGAAERLAGSAFEGSGRSYEWRKAWQLFLSAPWFGHGWGSYPEQGFLLDVYPTGYRPYENGVLFTHSHNSLLNLLAETGIAGTALVLGGMVWVFKGSLKTGRAAAGLFLLSLAGVSLTHSMVEYPLWYVYFLSVFALFLGFSPGGAPDAPESGGEGSLKTAAAGRTVPWRNIAGAAAALLLAAGIVRLGFVYQQLRTLSASGGNTVEQTEKLVGLLYISRSEPMLAYYADYQLSNRLDPNDKTFPDWAPQAVKSLRYRPFSNAYKWALVHYRNGGTDAAGKWMEAEYRYYPNRFTQLASAVLLPPYYPGLHEGFYTHCRRYYESVGQTPECFEETERTDAADTAASEKQH